MSIRREGTDSKLLFFFLENISFIQYLTLSYITLFHSLSHESFITSSTINVKYLNLAFKTPFPYSTYLLFKSHEQLYQVSMILK